MLLLLGGYKYPGSIGLLVPKTLLVQVTGYVRSGIGLAVLIPYHAVLDAVVVSRTSQELLGSARVAVRPRCEHPPQDRVRCPLVQRPRHFGDRSDLVG